MDEFAAQEGISGPWPPVAVNRGRWRHAARIRNPMVRPTRAAARQRPVMGWRRKRGWQRRRRAWMRNHPRLAAWIRKSRARPVNGFIKGPRGGLIRAPWLTPVRRPSRDTRTPLQRLFSDPLSDAEQAVLTSKAASINRGDLPNDPRSTAWGQFKTGINEIRPFVTEGLDVYSKIKQQKIEAKLAKLRARNPSHTYATSQTVAPATPGWVWGALALGGGAVLMIAMKNGKARK